MSGRQILDERGRVIGYVYVDSNEVKQAQQIKARVKCKRDLKKHAEENMLHRRCVVRLKTWDVAKTRVNAMTFTTRFEYQNIPRSRHKDIAPMRSFPTWSSVESALTAVGFALGVEE